ncbi:hypothetical protein ACNSTU_14485 [Aquisalimonas sp. APHAB1-3]|uniref:hypothetical protein n=1 Tax=Aquisalimonas sp. APHAB1-3 TaxID=3402080 RepID=UPI003AAD3E29
MHKHTRLHDQSSHDFLQTSDTHASGGATSFGQRRAAANTPVAGSVDDLLTPAEVRRRHREIVRACIAPPRDGQGGYLVWVHLMPPGSPAPLWCRLTHEDGAPLRFPDALKAHEKAIDCHLHPAQVTVRWPPRQATPDSPASVEPRSGDGW